MLTTTERDLHESSSSPELLDEPEQECLLRLSKLVARLFHVPVAYMALLGPDQKVITRIGSGADYWKNLTTYPLTRVLEKPLVWPGPSGDAVPPFDPGPIRFAAGAPLKSSDGLELGVLVIADIQPHPGFSQEDLETLSELASVLAGQIELRMIASHARESESLLLEAENRFRNIANYAPVMIIYSGIDGSVLFVNKAWLEFTGRTIEDELGAGYAEAFHPDYRDRVVDSYWDAFQLRKPRTIRFPMRRHDGEFRWMEARGVPRFLADGTFAGFIGCYVDLGRWDPSFG